MESDPHDHVDAADIAASPQEKEGAVPPTAPHDPVHDKPDPKHAQDLGWIGKFCGGRKEKVGNIAFATIIAAFIVLCATICGMIFANEQAAETLRPVSTGLIAIITAVLGYLFGKSS